MTHQVPEKAPTIPRVGITIPGNFTDDDPATGLENTLQLIVEAEQLGYDSAGVRQRQLETGTSSALTVLAAATQRTSRIALETNVVPLGFEVPFRLAEDFSTVDALSRGRVTVGVSSSAPHHELLEPVNRPDVSAETDPYVLLERFLEALAGRPLSDETLPTPFGTDHRPAVRPHIPGLLRRVWLGAGSDRSAGWAAERGLGIYLGNLTDESGGAQDGPPDFEAAQRVRIDHYRDAYRGEQPPRVALERVIVPLDSANPDQRARYLRFAESREERTRHRHGDRGTVIQRDLVGSTEEIADRLSADPSFDGATELRLALPYALAPEDYLQIITDTRG